MKFNLQAISLVSMVWVVSVMADTSSYQPQQTGPGPYPASGTPANAAPYPPSGWKPSGKQFPVPARQQIGPVSSARGYGPPSKGTTEFGVETEFTTVEPVTPPRPEPESENLNEFGNNPQIPDSGTYYVLLPDGRLQKVTYATMPLVETGRFQTEPDNQEQNQHGYLANVQYQDVEPIRGPIYAYNPVPLIRIFK